MTISRRSCAAKQLESVVIKFVKRVTMETVVGDIKTFNIAVRNLRQFVRGEDLIWLKAVDSILCKLKLPTWSTNIQYMV